MVFNFLNEDNLFDRYTESKRYTELLTEPFTEFERIARNKPKDNQDPKLPNVTDGTSASIVRKTPKRVVQQLPTGVIESDEGGWLPIVAEFVYTNKILPYANEDYDLIQKCWNQIERGLSFGSGASYTPFLNHDGYFCSDMVLPYWGDIFIQPGKKSGYASSYVFMRSWWQPEDIDALIQQEQQLKKSAKKRGEPYESSWDIEALKRIKKSSVPKDDKATTPSERDRNVSPTGIEMAIGFQKGVKATFYTFNPGSKEIVRRKINKDPRGKMPIDWLYGDIDGTNPLGRGLIELIGGLQNLIDADMQMYQWNRALSLAPPVVKKGNFSKSRIVFEPNRIIDVGNDPTAEIIPLKIDTSAIVNYPALYGLQKSQLLNLTASPDSSISAEVGNPGFSKTDAGVKQQNAIVSVDDNYVRKMFEKWFENWSETAVNVYFAERSGVEELQLDERTADRLRKLANEGEFNINLLSKDNIITIDYDTATPALRFRVDASTSKIKNDQDQLQALIGLLDVVKNNNILAQSIPQEKILAAWNKIVDASGVEDPEELSIDIEEFKTQQVQQQPDPRQLQEEEKLNQERLKTQQQGVRLQNEQVKLQTSQQPSEDEQIVSALQQLGVPDNVIAQALQMLDQGVPAEQVMQAITGAVV